MITFFMAFWLGRIRLQFANDMIFFYSGRGKAFVDLNCVPLFFQSISGVKINREKLDFGSEL